MFAKWLKQPGDEVRPGEDVCVWRTEAGDITIVFDGLESGWLRWHGANEGETVDVRGTVFEWSANGPGRRELNAPIRHRATTGDGGNAAPVMISYRRQDSEAYVGRLHENLTSAFGEGQVFLDIFSILPGADWELAIQRAAAGCRAMVAVIGPAWATAPGERGPRIKDPWDLLRLELTASLDRGTPVFPVLVGRAPLPNRDQLPSELWDLLRHQALELSSTGWRVGVAALVASIEQESSVGHVGSR